MLVYVPAWFLPAVRLPGESFGGGPTLGWEAFVLALRPILGDDVDIGVPLGVWMVSSAASNALLVVALALVCWRPSSLNRRLMWWLVAATAVNLYWACLPELLPDLRLGYYLWLSAFVLSVFATRSALRERALAASGGATAP